jgi:hypothetical protein
MLERWNTRQFPSQLKVSLQISVGAVVRRVEWKLCLPFYPPVCLGAAYALVISQECDEYAVVAQPHRNRCLDFVWALSTRHNGDNTTPGGASETGCQ